MAGGMTETIPPVRRVTFCGGLDQAGSPGGDAGWAHPGHQGAIAFVTKMSRHLPHTVERRVQKLNRPGFTGGQNSRRIARYGTDIKEENREAVFTRCLTVH